jgi:hypothetical protein
MFRKELYKETITTRKKNVKLIASIKINARKLKLMIIKNKETRVIYINDSNKNKETRVKLTVLTKKKLKEKKLKPIIITKMKKYM